MGLDSQQRVEQIVRSGVCTQVRAPTNAVLWFKGRFPQLGKYAVQS